MSNNFGPTELAKNWSLTFLETEFIKTYNQSAWLDVAVQMLAFRNTGLFPTTTNDVEKPAVEYISSQLNAVRQGELWVMPNVRTLQRRRRKIKEHYNIQPMSSGVEVELRGWLSDKHRKHRATAKQLSNLMPLWCFRRGVDVLPEFKADRLAKAVIADFDDIELVRIYEALTPDSHAVLKASLRGASGDPSFAQMKSYPGRVGLKTFVTTVKQVQFIKSLNLPDDIIIDIGSEFSDRYYRRAELIDALFDVPLAL